MSLSIAWVSQPEVIGDCAAAPTAQAHAAASRSTGWRWALALPAAAARVRGIVSVDVVVVSRRAAVCIP
jgi:hypothetical protein